MFSYFFQNQNVDLPKKMVGHGTIFVIRAQKYTNITYLYTMEKIMCSVIWTYLAMNEKK
jgi:hypothetical protein